MSYSRYLAAILTLSALGAGVTQVEAAQRRGPGSGAVGRAVPRGSAAPRIVGRPPIVRTGGIAPYRRYYYPYRPGIAVGFYAGYYPYGYPYRYYGAYGYGPYGYTPYGYTPYGYTPYDYTPYGYTPYGYPPPGYVASAGVAYGSVRIEGAPRDSQVFADGYYVGIVDDFDDVFQHLNLPAGPHHIEIQVPGNPPIAFDVRIEPGQTITYHATR